MKTALRIFLRDLKRILRNPVALIVTLGVCIIPSLYAWFNILANWDPYTNTSDIHVAVVNQDEGAEAGSMGYINAGDMVVEKLEENTQLGWTFPDYDEGMDGVNAGRYYATIVIPSDFTSSLADVLQGDTQKAHLEYYVNEKVNAVSPKVTDTGATTIEQQIDDTFAGTVSQVIAEKVADGSADILTEANDTQNDLESKVQGVKDGLDELKAQLDDTTASLGTARSAVDSAGDTLTALANVSDQSATTLRDSLNKLSDTRSTANTLLSQLSQSLATGSTQLGTISSTANSNIGTLAGDVSAGTTTFNDAIDRLESELAATGQIRTELENIRTLTASAENDGNNNINVEFSRTLDNSLSTIIPKLDLLTPQLQSQLDALKADSDSVNQAASNVGGLSSSLGDALSNTSSALTNLQSNVQGTTMPQLSSALDTFSDVGNGLSGTLSSVGPTLRQTQGMLSQLDGILGQAQTTIQSTSDQVGDASSDLGQLVDDLGAIRSSQLWTTLENASQLDAKSIGDFMNGPVKLSDEPVFPVENYGSGVTPFYTNLALWVGGFVLVAIYKLEVDKENIGDFKPWQGYLGRWLLLNLLGLVQAVVCCVGDIVLGIQCLDPVGFVFAGVVESFAYVGFIYALSIAFKHIGKALGVLLVVLQIPGASGTYPIEMMPDFFQALNPWLPFTYGINAMRESIAGYYGNYYVYNLFMLLLLLVPISVLIGMGARRHLLNINTLFDRKLQETGLMIAERVPAGEKQFKLSTLVKVAINSKEYSQVLVARAAKFELMYPVLIRRGFWSLIFVPLALLIIMFVVDAKFVLLMLWILSLVIICTFLIVVEYLHYRLNEKTELASYSQEQLLDMLDDKLKDELFAFAPIEKLTLTHESLIRRLRNLRNSVAAEDGASGGEGTPTAEATSDAEMASTAQKPAPGKDASHDQASNEPESASAAAQTTQVLGTRKASEASPIVSAQESPSATVSVATAAGVAAAADTTLGAAATAAGAADTSSASTRNPYAKGAPTATATSTTAEPQSTAAHKLSNPYSNLHNPYAKHEASSEQVATTLRMPRTGNDAHGGTRHE